MSLNIVKELTFSLALLRRTKTSYGISDAVAVLYKKDCQVQQGALNALYIDRERVRNLAPKRRCSSHTFRYGYLVTT